MVTSMLRAAPFHVLKKIKYLVSETIFSNLCWNSEVGSSKRTGHILFYSKANSQCLEQCLIYSRCLESVE